MGGKGYLMDSNAVINYLSNKLTKTAVGFMDGLVNAGPAVSVITKIEVLGYNQPSKDYELLENFINDSIVFDLNSKIVEQSIQLRKNHKIKLPDAIIAATAIVFNLILVTENLKDFNKIPNLQVISPKDAT